MYGPLSRELLENSRNDIYEYREEGFVLSSGKHSNHYFNCRKITLHPARLSLLGRILCDEVFPGAGLDIPQAVGGMTMGADPLTLVLALAFQERGQNVLPLIVRKEAKGHGLGRRIEGERENVKELVALDDVVTTGNATWQAIQVFREAGIKVDAAVCVIDRQEGGAELLAKEGVTLYSVFQKSDFR